MTPFMKLRFRAITPLQTSIFFAILFIGSRETQPYDPLNPPQGSYKPTSLVRLSNGSPLIGRRTITALGKRVTEFLGVPYAEPPIGPKRFGAPVPKKPWTAPWSASRLPDSCPQNKDMYFGSNFYGTAMWNVNTPLNEDCLYLNVWVPGWDTVDSDGDGTGSTWPWTKSGRPLPVMVWIFGGGFSSGTSTLAIYDGKILSAEENVIVVSMNYRVNAFGFMYLGIPEVAGNMGMLDQLEAIKWVHRNIKNFGGDHHSVTLFGESAGAGSVSLHSISPLTQPFFKRYILQSGSATAQWATSPKSLIREHSLNVARDVGCLSLEINKAEIKKLDFYPIFKCLQTVPVELLLKHETQSMGFFSMTWTPMVDGYFLVEEPRAAFEAGRFKKGQALVGSNLHEANYFLIYHLTDLFVPEKLFNQSQFIFSQFDFEKAALSVLPREIVRNPVATQAVLFEYSPHRIPGTPEAYQEALDKLVGDYQFTCNVQEFSGHFEKQGGTLYSYYFKHRSSVQMWPEWMGVLHGYEINYIFGEPLNPDLPKRYTEDEEKLSRRFMRYWANFARNGNPNINHDGTFVPENWPVFTKNQEYLVMSIGPTFGHGLRAKQCVFWKKYIPSLLESTKDLVEVEVKWKQEFNRWQTEYIVDWKSQFDQFKQLQKLGYCGAECSIREHP